MMADAQQFLRGSKVLYGPFMAFAGTCSLKEFLLTFQGPFLVGQDLYQGEMVEKTIREYNPTFRFQSNKEGNLEESSTINKHIFFLHYPDDVVKETRYSIGRTSNNDLAIVDYTISKLHAVIIKRQHRFIIVDQGATNGTTLNMVKLEPNKEYKLKDNDLVAFGRLGFVIMKPIKLFLVTRTHSGLGHTIRSEFLNILKYVKTHKIQKLAADIGIDNIEGSKKDIIQRLLKKLSVEQILVRLF